MKENLYLDYHNYDQINLTVKKQNADEVILSYGNFLWDLTSKKEDKLYHDILHLSFSRLHKIPNKDRLQLLQIKYEQSINDRVVMERSAHDKSRATFSIVIALCMCALFGILLLAFDIRGSLYVIGGIFTVIVILAFAVFLFIKARKISVKESENLKLKNQNIEVDIQNILSEAKLIAGVKNERA